MDIADQQQHEKNQQQHCKLFVEGEKHVHELPQTSQEDQIHPVCLRENCFYLRHSSEPHGYCCSACCRSSARRHDDQCERVLPPPPMPSEAGSSASSSSFTSAIVQLEWRKTRHREYRGWTSHSWLEAYSSENWKLRFEFFSDRGLTESACHRCEQIPESRIYDHRCAGVQEFRQALTVERLRQVVVAVASSKPYSMQEFNCHHFVLDVWNTIVVDRLRRRHYPDRAKTHMLRGAIGIVPGVAGRLWLGGLSVLTSRSRRRSEERNVVPDFAPTQRCSRNCDHIDVPLADHRQEASSAMPLQVAGDFEACLSDDPLYDYSGRMHCFVESLIAGSVFYLEPGREMTCLQAPSSSLSLATWPEVWLGDEVIGAAVAARLAERICLRDAEDLLGKIVHGSDSSNGCTPKCRGCTGNLRSLTSQKPGLCVGASIVIDTCFVVLHTSDELRLAVYIVLDNGARRCSGDDTCRNRRLRLLSGNAKHDEEGSFTYALADLNLSDLSSEQGMPTSSPAKALVDKELEPLQFAVSTGDWAFITLL